MEKFKLIFLGSKIIVRQKNITKNTWKKIDNETASYYRMARKKYQ